MAFVSLRFGGCRGTRTGQRLCYMLIMMDFIDRLRGAAFNVGHMETTDLEALLNEAADIIEALWLAAEFGEDAEAPSDDSTPYLRGR